MINMIFENRTVYDITDLLKKDKNTGEDIILLIGGNVGRSREYKLVLNDKYANKKIYSKFASNALVCRIYNKKIEYMSLPVLNNAIVLDGICDKWDRHFQKYNMSCGKLKKFNGSGTEHGVYLYHWLWSDCNVLNIDAYYSDLVLTIDEKSVTRITFYSQIYPYMEFDEKLMFDYFSVSIRVKHEITSDKLKNLLDNCGKDLSPIYYS